MVISKINIWKNQMIGKSKKGSDSRPMVPIESILDPDSEPYLRIGFGSVWSQKIELIPLKHI